MRAIRATATSSPGRRTCSEKRLRKACSAVTRSAVRASRTQRCSSTITVSGRDARLDSRTSPTLPSAPVRTLSSSNTTSGRALPSERSTEHSGPASKVRNR